VLDYDEPRWVSHPAQYVVGPRFYKESGMRLLYNHTKVVELKRKHFNGVLVVRGQIVYTNRQYFGIRDKVLRPKKEKPESREECLDDTCSNTAVCLYAGSATIDGSNNMISDTVKPAEASHATDETDDSDKSEHAPNIPTQFDMRRSWSSKLPGWAVRCAETSSTCPPMHRASHSRNTVKETQNSGFWRQFLGIFGW
jgi:hypothetical protein